MKNIKGNVLTDKQVLKANVRNAIKTKDLNDLATILADSEYELCEKKNALVLERQDDNGVPVYTVLTMTVSLKHPSELAERKHKKASAKETQEIEIE